MASVRETGFPDVDDNFLSCSICSEHYKNAKMLPCLHTFCESCIEKVAKKSGEVTCQICRRSYALPTSGVAGVEENAFINDMVSLFSKRVRISERLQKCEVCGQADSAKHCVECAVDMCEACASRHSRARSTKSHRLLTMEDYETAKSNDPASIQPPSPCNYHQDSQLELYCVTCDVAICHNCTTVDHPRPEHECIYLTNAAAEFRGVLTKMIAEEKSKKEWEVIRGKAAASATLDSLESCYKQAEKKLRECTRNTIESATRAIQEDGDTLLQELNELYLKKKLTLNAQIRKFECVETGLQHASEYSGYIMNYGNASHLITSKRGIVARFHELLKTETEVKPVDTGYLNFTPHDNFFGTGTLGVLATAISAADIRLDCPDLVRVNDSTSVICTLTTVFKHNNLDLIEQVEVMAILEKPDNSQEQITGINNGNGTWSFMSQTNMTGDYIVRVLVSNQQVQGSPGAIKVVPQKGSIQELYPTSQLCSVMATKGGIFRACAPSDQCLLEFTPQPQGLYALDTTIGCDLNLDIHARPTSMFSAASKCGRSFTVISIESLGYSRFEVLVSGEHESSATTFTSFTVKGRFDTSGIDVSPLDGKVYVACRSSQFPQLGSTLMKYDGDCVQVLEQNGTNVSVFNSGSEGRLFRPGGIAIDAEGKIYVSDEINHCIHVFDPMRGCWYSFGSEGSDDNEMKQPKGIALDSDSNVYVCDYGNNRVTKYRSDGTMICHIFYCHTGPTSVCVTDEKPFGNVIVVEDSGRVFAVFQ